MISRGVEISIAGGRGEMVRVLSLGPFFFFFLFSFFCNQIVIMFKGTKDSCSASYGDKKHISIRHPARFTSSLEKSNPPKPYKKLPPPSA